MSEESAVADIGGTAPKNPVPCPDDPDLQARIIDVLADLRSPTKQFVKSKRIARELDADVTNVEVGKQVRQLADRENPPVEEWCRGNGSRTWRILLEVDG